MSLPDLFVKTMHELLAAGATDVLEALETQPVVSLRLNPAKAESPSLKPALPDSPFDGAVPWASDGFYLKERAAFTFDPLFHAGCYYVQEASSMFLEQVVRGYVTGPVRALDLCAAPGGKSTLLRTALPEGSLLVSNELIAPRAQVLVENMVKWGHPGCVVTNNAPSAFAALPGFFDVVVADVPCSGEGMFRKDPVAVAEWSEANIETCWRRGRDIIAACWETLKPGGLLVYSTCTFNINEDEANVQWICEELGAEVLPVRVKPEWGITGNLAGGLFPVYRFLPGRTRGEGFFLAVLRKQGTPEEDVGRREAKRQNGRSSESRGACSRCRVATDEGKTKVRPAAKPMAVPQECREWLHDEMAPSRLPLPFQWQMDGGIVRAWPKALAGQIEQLSRSLRVLHAGVVVAELKGRDAVPAQSLAFSQALRREAFPEVPLTYAEALAYLRKESLQLSPEAPRGYVLLTFRGVPLGFAKNIGNRANNLYPAEWRIRRAYLPDNEVRVV